MDEKYIDSKFENVFQGINEIKDMFHVVDKQAAVHKEKIIQNADDINKVGKKVESLREIKADRRDINFLRWALPLGFTIILSIVTYFGVIN